MSAGQSTPPFGKRPGGPTAPGALSRPPGLSVRSRSVAERRDPLQPDSTRRSGSSCAAGSCEKWPRSARRRRPQARRGRTQSRAARRRQRGPSSTRPFAKRWPQWPVRWPSHQGAFLDVPVRGAEDPVAVVLAVHEWAFLDGPVRECRRRARGYVASTRRSSTPRAVACSRSPSRNLLTPRELLHRRHEPQHEAVHRLQCRASPARALPAARR